MFNTLMNKRAALTAKFSDVKENDILTFPEGMLGFSKIHQYVLVESEVWRADWLCKSRLIGAWTVHLSNYEFMV